MYAEHYTERTRYQSSVDFLSFSGNYKTGICPAEAGMTTAPCHSDTSILQTPTQAYVPVLTGVTDHCRSPTDLPHSLQIYPQLNDVVPDQHMNTSMDTPIRYSLRIFYQNVRGLRTKVDEFYLATSDADYDVIVLTETWLNDQIFSSQLFGDLYTVYRKDRNAEITGKKRGGGVIVAVSNRLKSVDVTLPAHDQLEQLWVRVSTASNDVCIGVIYIPPEYATDPHYIEQHIECASHVAGSLGLHDSHLILGDYNQPGLVWKNVPNNFLYPDPCESSFNRSNSALIDGMSVLDMNQLNPVINHSDRILDLVFCYEKDACQCSITEADEPLVAMDAFHPALLVSLNCPQKIPFIDTMELSQFNFRKTDFSALNRAILEKDWTPLYTAENVNDAVRILTDTLLELFRVYAPATRRTQGQPWSNQRLRILKRKRAKALRHYSANRNIVTKQEFQVASNRYKNYNRLLYSYYVRRRQNDLKRNPKRFWTFVNEKRKVNGFPSVMSYGTETASSSAEICNLFASHFSSVFKSDVASAQHIVAALRNVPEGLLGMQNIVFTEANI